MMPRKHPKEAKPIEPTPREQSKAKKKLEKGIRDGTVHEDMSSKEVFEMREEYKVFKYKDFQTILKSLLNEKLQARADAESAALAHDLKLYPRAMVNQRGYPRWEGSEAERQLKLAIDAGQHNIMKPSELHKTREEFQAFPLDVFRGHIYQETRSRKERPHWSSQLVARRQKYDEEEE